MLKKITSPKRNQGMYSSQKHLIEEDTSTDENLVIKSRKNSYINNAASHSDTDNYEQIPLKIIRSPETKKNIVESSDLDVEEIIDITTDASPKKKRIKRKKVEKSTAEDITIIKDQFSEHESSDTTISNVEKSNKQLLENKLPDKNDSVENNEKIEKIGSGVSKKRNKSAKKQKAINNEAVENIDIENMEESKSSEDIDDVVDDSMKLIGVHIISSDMLANHLFLHCPYVKIYIINSKTGNVINTINSENKYNYSTRPFEFYKKGTILPQWDEIILLDAALAEKLKSLSNIIIFFKICDQKTTDDETGKADECICWAFIKLLSHKKIYNINKKLKLQMYCCDIETSDSKIESVYNWWKNKPWKPYPSALYTIIKGVTKDVPDETINEIKFSISQNALKFNEINSAKFDTSTLSNKNDVIKRSKGEQCKIPNKIMSVVQNDDGASTILKFSKCGNYLACSAKSDTKYIIIIYKVPECEEVTRLLHHRELLYDISWNFAGNKIISASADCVAYIWDITDPQKYLKQKLIHPAYVYTAKFCNCNEDIIATGSYDKLLRIWTTKTESGQDVKSYKLSEELDGHTGFINAVCFSECNEMFFSGDSQGNIFKWAKGKNSWIKIMDICIDEFRSKIINDLILFPGGHKLLVILRNHPPWALDIATSTMLTCYKDGILDKYQTRGCISSCGTFIFSSNNVWIASSGELYANYNPAVFDNHTIMSIDLHPFYDIIAFASANERTPILLCNHKQSGYRDPNLGLEMYSTSLLLHPGIVNENYTEKHFKTAVKKVQKETGDKSAKNKEFKLWNLLRKMDNILSNARKGQTIRQFKMSDDEKPKLYIENEKQLKNNKSSSESNLTISIDLTEFHKKMQIGTKISNEINNDAVLVKEGNNSSGTYTLENEKHATIKNKYVKPLKNSQIDVEDSSTLSNAESLEDDSNTYIISIDK